MLLIIDESPDQTLSLWEWQKGERGQRIAETRVLFILVQELILAMVAHPFIDVIFIFLTYVAITCVVLFGFGGGS